MYVFDLGFFVAFFLVALVDKETEKCLSKWFKNLNLREEVFWVDSDLHDQSWKNGVLK